MIYLYETDNALVWAGEIVNIELHTKSEETRRLTLDELDQIAEYIGRYVKHAREEELCESY